MTNSGWLDRAREELDTAPLLADAGYPRPAVSRAYYAAFYAAKAALNGLGHDPSTHAGMNAAFGRYVVKQSGVSPDAGRALNRLLDRRILADYEIEPMTD